jgi:hypothetical protein
MFGSKRCYYLHCDCYCNNLFVINGKEDEEVCGPATHTVRQSSHACSLDFQQYRACVLNVYLGK